LGLGYKFTPLATGATPTGCGCQKNKC